MFFQLMATVSKENLNLQLPLIFCTSIRFVFQTVFISEKIAENRFRNLLEISDKLITKLNVFSYMILQFKLKTVWKISQPCCITLKTQRLVSFSCKAIVCSTKVRDETFRNQKHMKVNHSVSSPPTPSKVWGTFFLKKLCMGGQAFLGKFMGGCLTWGLMIKSCKGV